MPSLVSPVSIRGPLVFPGPKRAGKRRIEDRNGIIYLSNRSRPGFILLTSRFHSRHGFILVPIFFSSRFHYPRPGFILREEPICIRYLRNRSRPDFIVPISFPCCIVRGSAQRSRSSPPTPVTIRRTTTARR